MCGCVIYIDENDSFFPKLYQNIFGPPEFGVGVVTQCTNLYFFHNLLPSTTIQNMMCRAFLEVFQLDMAYFGMVIIHTLTALIN